MKCGFTMVMTALIIVAEVTHPWLDYFNKCDFVE